MNRLKLIYSSATSAIFAIIVAVVITIAAEYSAAFKAFLKSWTGHHWTTKSWAVAIIYFAALAALYLSSRPPTPHTLRKILRLLVATAILGYIVLLGFYAWHYSSGL